MSAGNGTPHRISAIVTTLGRGTGLPKLLRSLDNQTQPPHELLVVDQNEDPSGVACALDGSWAFTVEHIHVPGTRGASRGRNAGASRATGDVLVFPDDDCWYPSEFLATVTELFKQRDVSFVCGRATDETGRTINGRFEATQQDVTRHNVWTTAIEWLQAFRAEAFVAVRGFDEEVGVGAATPWQSAEAQDIALRLLATGYRGLYDPNLVGHHDELPVHSPDRQLRVKLRRYARGMGYVLRKYNYGPAENLKWFLRPLGGLGLAMVTLKPRRAALYGHVVIGRVEGYLRHTFPL